MVSEEEIRKRVAALGKQIAADYRGMPLTLVGVLKGAFLFMGDLIREIELELMVDFVEISTYGDRAHSSGVIRINKDLKYCAEGSHVLIVEDIVDTGLTMRYLVKHLQIHHPLSIKICTLLRKEKQGGQDVQVDYVGFKLTDEFVVGYGLDYAGKFRNLKDIRAVPKHVYENEEKHDESH